jgi:transcriptional regulator with XRE-family HTH domain
MCLQENNICRQSPGIVINSSCEVMDMPETPLTPRQKRKLLRKVREQGGLSLEELGKRSGLSRSMISKFELGKRDLSEQAWQRVADAMEKFLIEDVEKFKAQIEKSKAQIASMERDLAAKQDATGTPARKLGVAPMSLRALAGGAITREAYAESCRRAEQEYGPHWREVFQALIDGGRREQNLEARIGELRDLLAVETHMALDEAEARDIRERIAMGDKKETTPKDGDD